MKKRKIFCIIFAVIMAFSIYACTDTDNPANNPNADVTNQEDNKNDVNGEDNQQDSENTDVPERELHPDGVSRLEAQEICFVTDSTVLPQTLPVYIDKYTVEQTGPMYEITDKLYDELSDNLEDFLCELYGDGKYDISMDKQYSIPEVSFKKDDRIFSANPGYIQVYTTEINLYRDTTSENICENELVRAAMEYVDIDEPQIKMTVTNNLSGEIDKTVYTISEKTNSVSEHIRDSSFEYVSVSQIAGASEAIVLVCDIDDLKVFENVKVMTLDEAVKAVTDKYPQADKSKVKAELTYRSDAKTGYFTPCYILYIEKEIDGYEKLYDVINVPFAYAYPFYTSLDVKPKE